MKNLIAVMLIAFTSCNTSNTATVQSAQNLTRNSWVLKTIYQGKDSITVSEKNVTLRFETEKNSAGGKGGCNSFGAKYDRDGDNINFRDIFSTKMYCEQFQKTEDAYFAALEKVNRFSASETELILYQGNQPLLVFGK